MSSSAAIMPTDVGGASDALLATGKGVPAAVREGSPKASQAYESARGFEEMLLEQLTQSLIQTSGLGGEGEGAGGVAVGEGGSPSPGSGGSGLASLLAQALAEGVTRNGGVGLAGQLAGELDPTAGKPSGGATGGTAA